MTITYDSTNNQISIDSTLIDTYLTNTTQYNIDILIDDVSNSTAPTVNPHIVDVTADTLISVTIKLNDTTGGTITIEQGCILADSTLYCKSVELANTNQDINLLIDYFLFSKANECPCECTKLKEMFDKFTEQINDCEC
jgi:hypothetical protein